MFCIVGSIESITIVFLSSDNTLKIAKEYEKKYPGIVKAIHKENGGHGSGVNKGLSLAKGLYYKVVDSDDWVDEKSLKKVLETICQKNTSLVYMRYYI